MLPRKLRLSRRELGTTRRMMRATSPHFSISYNPNAKRTGATVVVPKKVVRLATKRNRLKRRIRPLLLPYLGEKRVLVVYVRPSASDIPFPGLRDELTSLLASRLPGILPKT